MLKKKIQASKEAKQRASLRTRRKTGLNLLDSPTQTSKHSNRRPKSPDEKPTKRKRLKGRTVTPKIYLQTKNIVTNFGKAIASFASSELAIPYLKLIVEQLKQEGHQIEMSNFSEFTSNTKGNIGSIDSLRALMLEEENDTALVLVCKRIFRMIGEVFIKYFSVNWITHGRITYKMAHLKFRHRMLRRVRNPALFTYLKGYNGQKRALKRKNLNFEN